jgi:hypothetical protein
MYTTGIQRQVFIEKREKILQSLPFLTDKAPPSSCHEQLLVHFRGSCQEHSLKIALSLIFVSIFLKLFKSAKRYNSQTFTKISNQEELRQKREQAKPEDFY